MSQRTRKISEDEKSFLELTGELDIIKNLELRKEIQDRLQKFRLKFKQNKEKQIDKLKTRIDSLKRKSEDPNFLIKVDEVTYSVVLTSFVFTFGLLFYPKTQITFSYILIKLGILFFLRFFEFKRKKWHYYLIEYCYFVNWLMFFTLIFFYKNKYLLCSFFLNALGPVASSFLFLRYRIAWHDLSAYTSFFMHIAPGIVAWIMRFHYATESSDTSNWLPTKAEWETWLADMGPSGYLKIFVYGMIFYLSWALPYYFVRFHFAYERIEREGNDSLFHYTRQNSAIYKFMTKRFNKGGNQTLNQIIYMSIHGTVSFFSFFVSAFLFYRRYLTFCLLVGLLIMPIWSTSNYYHEHFTHKYQRDIQKEAEKNRHKRMQEEELKKQDSGKEKSE